MVNETQGKEQRKHQRFQMGIPVLAKASNYSSGGEQVFKEFLSKDISMGGVYLTASEWNVRPQEEVVVSISVPREKTRVFPFSRLAGKAKVVRIEQYAQQRWQGVALQFSDDLTYLAAAPGY